MPRSYSLFGLTVRSAVPLPCPDLPRTESDADVELIETTHARLDALCVGAPTSVEDDGFWRSTLYPNGAASVHWKDHFDFVVSGDGRQVRWRRLADVTDEMVVTYLLGQALSFCLLARGVEPLHATSVVVNGAAIAFLGDSGHGKSTLAAALLERGYRLLTDDVLVVRFDGQCAMAYPSLARIKLTPESADAVLRGRSSVSMNHFTAKRIFPLLDEECASRAAPLRAMYVIAEKADDAALTIRELGGSAQFLSVIQNTFNDSVLDPARVKQQFCFARRLVGMVPIKRLAYPRDLVLLPAIADAVLADSQRVEPR